MNKTIYALGFFDGVHMGHAALMRECLELAGDNDCRGGVITFDSHPDILTVGHAPRLINAPMDRDLLLLHYYGMDTVTVLPFDEKMQSVTWYDFLEMLIRDYDAAGFVCGDDFRFGHKGAGTAQLLQEFCRQRNMPCSLVPQQLMDGIRISSTYIRSQIEEGDMATAVAFLGHPHILSGQVIHGKKLGRKLGIPTANMILPKELVKPQFGVYACKCVISGTEYLAVTNIGMRPTVSGEDITVETWILDYQGEDLYGQYITLEIHRFLRKEQKFDTLEDLKAQIHRDAEETRKWVRL